MQDNESFRPIFNEILSSLTERKLLDREGDC